MSVDDAQKLMTPAEVAGMLQVKLPRIYEADHDRRLPAIKVGRLLRFRPQDIKAFPERSITVR